MVWVGGGGGEGSRLVVRVADDGAHGGAQMCYNCTAQNVTQTHKSQKTQGFQASSPKRGGRERRKEMAYQSCMASLAMAVRPTLKRIKRENEF